MRTIEYRKGDVLKTDIKHIMHGCNCLGVMGSGIAKQIRTIYPAAYTDYRDAYEGNGLFIGSMIFSEQPDGKTIINAMTQESAGTSRVQVSYWAVANVFHVLNNILKGDQQVAMPMIGAGLGGGDWNVISAIIENEAVNYRPVVYQL